MTAVAGSNKCISGRAFEPDTFERIGRALSRSVERKQSIFELIGPVAHEKKEKIGDGARALQSTVAALCIVQVIPVEV